MRMRSPSRLPSLCLLSAAFLAATAGAQRFHMRRAVDYRRAPDDNAVTELNRRIAAGEVEIASEGTSGRLRALLRELGVPESSQTLVFSKTSLQRHRVSPRSPRAVYFGPDAYVGWAPGSRFLEVAASDPGLGIVFYRLAQDESEGAVLQRDNSCLSCHASSRTRDEPGLLLRSVFPDENGNPIASAGEDDVTMRTPMADRWGGWLVTGTFEGEHRGNGVARRDEDDRWHVASRAAPSLHTFAADFDPGDYLVETSDIGALLALEQQITVHNRLIHAGFQMRCLLDADRCMNEATGESGLREQTAEIAESLAHDIARDLFMGAEAPLAGHDAAADPRFAREFAALWPADSDGVRLGELSLQQTVFELPLSPMVHSAAFAALPDELRERVLARLWKGLTRGRLPAGVSIPADRRAVLHAHLRATLAGYDR